MKIINRLYQYFEFKGIKPTRFEKEIGLSNGYLGNQLKRSADLGESIVYNIVKNCRDLNIIWLLTGEGEMLNQEPEHNVVNDQAGQYIKSCPLCRQKDEIINALKDANYALKLALKHCTEENCKQTGS